MKMKQIKAKPSEDDPNKGLKFTSIQPPDISASLAIAKKAKQKPKKTLYCRICGSPNCQAPDRIMVERG